MKNELSITSTDLIEIMLTHGVSDLISPFIKEIYLFETIISGTSHIDDTQRFIDLQIGEQLYLTRQKDNPFDANAILITNSKKQKLGYVPRKDNTIFTRLLDAGKILTAKVKKIEHNDYRYLVTIDIYLIDY